MTRLAAAMAWMERSNETNPDGLRSYPWSSHTAWAVKKASGGWLFFASYEEAAKHWGPYVLGPTYTDLTILAHYIGKHAPWSDGNDPDDYGRKAAAHINARPLSGSVPDDDDDIAIVFGTATHPDVEKTMVDTPWISAGDEPVPTGRHTVGMGMHTWWGFGDQDAVVRLFGPGGERQADAITASSLTLEGELVMRNEPWGTRAGWAHGPAHHLDGDGPRFIRTRGVGAVHRRCST
jgi:hypothetical protein